MAKSLIYSGELLRRAEPNKPVLPTATTWIDEDSIDLLRRQTGQPLGRGPAINFCEAATLLEASVAPPSQRV